MVRKSDHYVWGHLQSERLEDIPDLFDTFDADDSGTMTVVELLKGVKKLRGDPRRSDVIGVSLVVQAIHELVSEATAGRRPKANGYDTLS